MKIVLICAGLEPGKDGVGDYSRRLAAALLKQGHQAAIVALNDRFIQAESDGIQTVDGENVSVLRLPAHQPFGQRIASAKQWIDNKAPGWLSLQFVPFGFHPKGLRFNLAAQLKKLGSYRWHFMFHELWVGMDVQSPRKHFFWGWLQRRLILSLIKTLKPGVIHTQSRLYIYQLQRFGVKAGLLPLFGNIPVIGTHVQGNTAEIRLIVFGNIHHGAPVEQFAAEAAAYSQASCKNITLIFTGRNGPEQVRWLKAWRDAGLNAMVKDELSSPNLSALLSSMTAGICTTPLLLADKSGSVAAMHEHGLPVIALARPWQLRQLDYEQAPAGITPYVCGTLKDFLNSAQMPGLVHANNVSDIAGQFIDSLNGKF